MRSGIPQALTGFLIGAVAFATAEIALSEAPTLAHSLVHAAGVEPTSSRSVEPTSSRSVEPTSSRSVEPEGSRSVAPAPAPALSASAQTISGCPCPQPKYVRSSGNYAVAKADTYVELDSDAGLPITVTLPAAPAALERHEIWLGAQPGLPGGTVTIDPSGQAVALFGGVDLVLDSANDGLVLLFVQPAPPPAGGYWRVSKL